MDNETFWSGMPGILTALAGLIAAVGTLIGVLHTTGILRRKGAGGGGSGPKEEPSIEADAPGRVSTETTSVVAASPLILRSAPAILSGEKMSAMLVRRGFFDKRRNPSGGAPAEAYETRVDGEMLMVVDPATGLTWEMGGSDRPVRFDEAGLHIDRLKGVRAGGFADWRVPTAEEAMSLMRRGPVDGFHIAADFRRGVNFIWTADLLEDGGRAWIVYFADGTIEAESKDFNAWVRAVR